MFEWNRDAPEARRNNGREDPGLAALRARGDSLLAANWRVRIRGNRRPPVRPLRVALSVPSLNEDGKTTHDVPTRGSTNGTAPRRGTRGANGRQESAETDVLVFPEIVLPPPDEPVRGPLSWAYWSARRK